MISKRRWLGFGSALAVMGLVAQTAVGAVLLPPGATIPGAIPDSVGAGAIQLATISVPYTTPTLSGTYTTTVWTHDINNAFGLGGLTFEYTVATSVASSDAVGRVTVGGWAINAAAVGNISLVTVPSTFDRSLSGSVIGANFAAAAAVNPGQTIDFLVQSPLHGWASAFGGVIDETTATVRVLAPVPEPTTMIAGALLLLPFGASTLRVFRKNRAS